VIQPQPDRRRFGGKSAGPAADLWRETKRQVKRVMTAAAKRNLAFRKVSRSAVAKKRTAEYARHCRNNPIENKTIMFESFMGRGYSDSPKALYRAMLADPKYDDFTFIWAFKEPENFEHHPEMERAQLVLYGNPGYYAAHARARYWVTNSVIPAHVYPRENQVYIQTWHGTPFKRLGADIAEESSANAKYTANEITLRYTREGDRLTYLLSPSGFTTEKFSSAFALSPEEAVAKIVEEGYPRNDDLFHYTDERIAEIRDEHGVPADKKVILYAPTWRDNQHVSGLGYTLKLPVDFDQLQRELADEYVILFRAHYFVANEFDFARYEGFIKNVSNVSDINDLYIVSDMLVTDYSSVFFDYATLHRPILFYMYDLEEYVRDIRGFYFDLAELPGPVVKTEVEFVSAVRAADAPTEELQERYKHFIARFAHRDDGYASQRVLERVIDQSDVAAR